MQGEENATTVPCISQVLFPVSATLLSQFPTFHVQSAFWKCHLSFHFPIRQYFAALSFKHTKQLGCVFPFPLESIKAQTLNLIVWV